MVKNRGDNHRKMLTTNMAYDDNDTIAKYYNNDSHLDCHHTSSDHEDVCDMRMYRQMKHLTLQMNAFGFYMVTPHHNSSNRHTAFQRCSNGCRRAARMGLYIVGVLLVVVNFALFGLNAYWWHLVSQVEGVLALVPVNIVITSMKVLQNGFHFIYFLAMAKQFEACNCMIMHVASSYSKLFDAKFDVQRLVIRNWIIIGVVAFVALGSRISRFVVEDYKIGSSPLNDISIVLTPLLQVWQVLPLLYFSCISYIVLQLITSLRSHLVQQTESLQFYYSHFLTYRKLVRKWNETIDFFVIYSMFLSIVVLCMAIYYMVRAEDAFNIDPNLPFESKVMSYYSYWWCALQISVAILYVFVVCTRGGEINRAIKSLIPPILERVSTNTKECFQQSLFLESIKDETMYFGIWKTIPFPRELFFKVAGILITYSVLIMRQAKDLNNPSKNGTMALKNN